MSKLISVIMPVYNTPLHYFTEAVNSILNQTFTNFELIIIDDGSDITYDIVQLFDDCRIRYFRNKQNMGLSYSLNKGFHLAEGDYIARMDSDDIALPQRLEYQINYMEKHTEVDILGTAAKKIGAAQGIYSVPTFNTLIKITLLIRCPFIHPSIMIRKNSFFNCGIFYTTEFKAEDYNLWIESAFIGRLHFHNLHRPLLLYRIHDEQITSDFDPTINYSLIYKALTLIGNKTDESLYSIYWNFVNYQKIQFRDYPKLYDFLNKLVIALHSQFNIPYLLQIIYWLLRTGKYLLLYKKSKKGKAP